MKIHVQMASNILFWSVYLCTTFIYGDCFQQLAEEVQNGLIAGVSETSSIGESFAILLTELESCTGSTGTELYAKILENEANLKYDKIGSIWEKRITSILATNYPIDVKDMIKVSVVKWYESDGVVKQFYFNMFSSRDILRTDMYSLYKDFSIYTTLLADEPSTDTELSKALIDYMFCRSPGQALITMNDTLSEGQIEDLKIKIDPLIRWHSWMNPELWKNEDLELGKRILTELVYSKYAYIDIFIAEIVNVVHELRTPEVDTFLAQSAHPLVQRRLREPFIYVPLAIPE